MGATSNGSSTWDYANFMNSVGGSKFEVIAGYQGSPNILLAMERGEVMGRGSNAWASWKSTHPQWLRDKKVDILVQIGLKKADDLPDVPLLMDLATNPDDRAALMLLSAGTAIGRSLGARSAPELEALSSALIAQTPLPNLPGVGSLSNLTPGPALAATAMAGPRSHS